MAQIVGTPAAKPVLTGADLLPTSKSAIRPYNNAPIIEIQLTPHGSQVFADFTGQHVGEVLAIFYDGRLLTAPRINEKITNGMAEISGFSSLREATDVASCLNGGALPVHLKVFAVQKYVPSLIPQAEPCGRLWGHIRGQDSEADMTDTKFEGEDYESAPIIRIAYSIIQQGIVDGASEILIEPGGQRSDTAEAGVEIALRAMDEQGAKSVPGQPWLRVSEKIGDDWHEIMPLPDYIQEPLTQRFKKMADVDLRVTDKSQEGRIPICYSGKNYELRTKTTPTPLGEQVLMRFVTL